VGNGAATTLVNAAETPNHKKKSMHHHESFKVEAPSKMFTQF